MKDPSARPDSRRGLLIAVATALILELGAGDYKPAIVLDGRKAGNRQPIALTGKACCKVDADLGAIQIGDLLTTSPTSGHAMIAAEPGRALGSIIGKALGPHASGKGMIPILVALQ